MSRSKTKTRSSFGVLELPAAASVEWRALPTRCPGEEPEPVVKDASHTQTSLALKLTIPSSFIFPETLKFALSLINECQLFLCFTIRNYLARDQSNVKGGANYVHGLIRLLLFLHSIFFYFDRLRHAPLNSYHFVFIWWRGQAWCGCVRWRSVLHTPQESWCWWYVSDIKQWCMKNPRRTTILTTKKATLNKNVDFGILEL